MVLFVKKGILLCTALLGLCFLAVAQGDVFNLTAQEWADKIKGGSAEAKEALKQLKKDNPESPLYWLAQGEFYRQEAQRKNPFSEHNQITQTLDSANNALQLVQQLTTKKYFKKYTNYYTAFFSTSSISLENLADFIQQKVERNEDLKKQTISLSSTFNEAAAYYSLSQKRYQSVQEEHASQDAIKLLHESVFVEQFVPIAYNYLQAKALLDKAYALADSFFMQSPTLIVTEKPMATFCEGNTISVYNFQQWYENLAKVRHFEIAPLQQKSITSLSALLSIENRLVIDSTNADLSVEIPTIAPLLSEWQTLEQSNLFTAFLQFKAEKIALMKRVLEEKSYFVYNHGQEEIFEYYYEFQEQIRELNEQLNYINAELDKNNWQYYASILEANFADEQTFRKALNTEKSYLNKRFRYAELKIRNQLLYENIELKFLPRYSEYNGSAVPLFEQPMNMVAEEGDYVTIRVLKDNLGNLYLTGYRKVKGKKGFVARVVGQRISWINWAEKPAYIQQKDYDSYGAILSPDKQGGCLAVMQFKVKGDATFKNPLSQLVAMDSSGTINNTLALQTELDINKILPMSENADSFLTASLGNIPLEEFSGKSPARNPKQKFTTYNGIPIPDMSQPEGASGETSKQILPEKEALVVSKLNFEGKPEWVTSFPFKGSVIGILEMDDRFVLVCNQQQETNLNEHKIHLIALGKKGNIIAQKTIDTNSSCFATRTVKLEGNKVLVVGFKGEYEINSLENKGVMNMLINQDLELLESSME